jgi:SAM-dependent methyltransferase
MDLKSIWDRFTDQYSFLPIHPQFYMKRYTSTAIDLAREYSKGLLLDIGCGRMPYKSTLLPFVDKYVGLDHPETAKLYKGKDKPDIFADATKIPLKNGSCNTVLCLQVIEHLPEPNEAIKEISRLLSKDGYLILSTIQSYPIHDEPYDYFRYTKYGLRALVENNGLKLIKIIEGGNVFILIQQSFNIFLMLQIKKLIKSNTGKVLALLFIFPVLFITTFTNILVYPLQYLDVNSKFRQVVTIVAKK